MEYFYRITHIRYTVLILNRSICERAFLTNETSTRITSFKLSDTARATSNGNGRHKCALTSVVPLHADGTKMAKNEGAQKCRSAQLKNLPGALPT